MEDLTYWDALAALEWQVDLGADEAIADQPVDRFAVPKTRPDAPTPAATTSPPAKAPPPRPAPPPQVDTVAVARAAAEAATDLDALRAALAGFQHCDLRHGARNLVFADGDACARVMVIGEAPGRDEDLAGKPFVGRAGQLLDKMFAAIGLGRGKAGADGLYITNMLPWRPPQNRDPKPEELAMLRPFVERHIALAKPDLVVLMGNHACAGLIGKRGITRLRGTWVEVLGHPAMPMFHPAFLLRNPAAKAAAWADLLEIRARLSQ